MDINQTFQGVSEISQNIPSDYRIYLLLGIYAILIVIYAIVVWKYYRFLARRDIIQFDLSQYNRSKHPLAKKLVSGLFFLLKYILIMPLIVIFWFVLFSIFLLVLSQEQSIIQILVISAAMITAVRITSYYSADLSKDLGKMFPFTVLAVFLINPNFNIQSIINKVNQIPDLFNHILVFLGFIVFVEFIMRMIVLVQDLFESEEEISEENNSQEKT